MRPRPSSKVLSRTGSLLGATTVAMLLGACASQPYNARGAVVPQAMYQPAEASNPYTQTAWVLRQWLDVSGSARKLPALQGRPAPVTMVLQQSNGRREISGWVACNQYSGDYTVANGLIILTSDLASTGHDCGTSGLRQLEQTYLEAMKHVVQANLDDYSNPRVLTLRLADGDRLEFARQQMALFGADQPMPAAGAPISIPVPAPPPMGQPGGR